MCFNLHNRSYVVKYRAEKNLQTRMSTKTIPLRTKKIIE